MSRFGSLLAPAAIALGLGASFAANAQGVNPKAQIPTALNPFTDVQVDQMLGTEMKLTPRQYAEKLAAPIRDERDFQATCGDKALGVGAGSGVKAEDKARLKATCAKMYRLTH